MTDSVLATADDLSGVVHALIDKVQLNKAHFSMYDQLKDRQMLHAFFDFPFGEFPAFEGRYRNVKIIFAMRIVRLSKHKADDGTANRAMHVEITDANRAQIELLKLSTLTSTWQTDEADTKPARAIAQE